MLVRVAAYFAPPLWRTIKWNFAKFLVGRDGRVLSRYSPMVTPEDAGLVADIEAALAS